MSEVAWLPALSGALMGSPWAVGAGEVAGDRLALSLVILDPAEMANHMF